MSDGQFGWMWKALIGAAFAGMCSVAVSLFVWGVSVETRITKHDERIQHNSESLAASNQSLADRMRDIERENKWRDRFGKGRP